MHSSLCRPARPKTNEQLVSWPLVAAGETTWAQPSLDDGEWARRAVQATASIGKAASPSTTISARLRAASPQRTARALFEGPSSSPSVRLAKESRLQPRSRPPSTTPPQPRSQRPAQATALARSGPRGTDSEAAALRRALASARQTAQRERERAEAGEEERRQLIATFSATRELVTLARGGAAEQLAGLQRQVAGLQQD